MAPESRDASGTELLAALTHPVRRRLLESVLARDRSVRELRQALNLDTAAVAHHLAALLAEHLIEARGGRPAVRYGVRDLHRAALEMTRRRRRAGAIALEDLPRRRTRRRVICGSMFHREIALLNWRCRELAAVVDDFVVVEATVRHSGDARDLVRPAGLPLFADLSGRLHGVVVDGLPEGPDPWSRERKQREAIWTRGVASLARSDHDLVIVSDLDEVPFPDVVDRLAFSRIDAPLRLRPHWFNFDWNTYLGAWPHASIHVYTAGFLRRLFAAGRGADFGGRTVPAREIRGLHGWHASWFGDDALLLDKLASYAHALDEKDRRALAEGPHGLAARRAAGFDMFHERRKLDGQPRLPAYARLLTPGAGDAASTPPLPS